MSNKLAQQRLFAADAPPTMPLKGKGDVHVGTSGYIFSDWRGEFYPKKLPQNRWLEYYSNIFSAVEINATYYTLLPASSFERMAESTSENFKFWVKVPADLTHNIQNTDVVADQFIQSLSPLIECGKLCGLLAQFPPSFDYNANNLAYIQHLREIFFFTELAIEFRSSIWSHDDVYDLFNINDLTPVIVDLPAISGLPETVLHYNKKIAYVRLHGRNEKTWYNQTLGDRYDYNYSSSELELWCTHLVMMSEMAGTSYLFFNNCHAGQAVRNAVKLRELLAYEFTFNSDS